VLLAATHHFSRHFACRQLCTSIIIEKNVMKMYNYFDHSPFSRLLGNWTDRLQLTGVILLGIESALLSEDEMILRYCNRIMDVSFPCTFVPGNETTTQWTFTRRFVSREGNCLVTFVLIAYSTMRAYSESNYRLLVFCKQCVFNIYYFCGFSNRLNVLFNFHFKRTR